MSKKPPNDRERPVAERFPGLASQNSVKTISVQRPLDSDEKTVIASNFEPPETASATSVTTSKKASSQVARGKAAPQTSAEQDRSQEDDTVLELPPSPEHRKARRRRTLWVTTISVLLLLVGGWAVLYFSPILAIEEISHEGLDLVAESEAEERTAVLIDTPLPQVNDGNVTELFADTPAVDDVTLRAEPPHGLVVIVNEHTPVAMSPRGKQYVVFSEAGTELAEIPSKKAQEFDLPVVASASDVADQEIFDSITRVLGTLPDDLRDQVRAASGASIDSIELELSSGKTVMWGNTEQADKKVRVLEALLGLDKEQAAKISEYNVSAPDFPVTR
jgi:cell division protein FtsQ